MLQGTSFRASQLLRYITDTQSQMALLESQIASGKKAQTFLEQPEAGRTVTYEALLSRRTQFIRNAESAEIKLSIADTVVKSVEEIGVEARRFELFTGYDPDRAGTTQATSANWHKNVHSFLNSRTDEGYLFGGLDTLTKPVEFPFEVDDAAWLNVFGTDDAPGAATPLNANDAEDVAVSQAVTARTFGSRAPDATPRTFTVTATKRFDAGVQDNGTIVNSNGNALPGIDATVVAAHNHFGDTNYQIDVVDTGGGNFDVRLFDVADPDNFDVTVAIGAGSGNITRDFVDTDTGNTITLTIDDAGLSAGGDIGFFTITAPPLNDVYQFTVDDGVNPPVTDPTLYSGQEEIEVKFASDDVTFALTVNNTNNLADGGQVTFTENPLPNGYFSFLEQPFDEATNPPTGFAATYPISAQEYRDIYYKGGLGVGDDGEMDEALMARLDTDLDVPTGFSAGERPFEKLMMGLQMAALNRIPERPAILDETPWLDDPQDPQKIESYVNEQAAWEEDKQRYVDWMEEAHRLIREGSEAVDTVRVRVTSAQITIDNNNQLMVEMQTMEQNLLSGLQDADPTEAVVKLQTLQYQLQASYEITSRVSELTLVNFL